MSGLEIVLIVAAGVAIAHKLDERKKRKRAQRELLAQGSANGNSSTQPTEQAGSRIRRPNQQVPVEEEEALPLYSKDQLAPSGQEHLPTYDELGSQRNTAQQDYYPPEKLGSSSQVHELGSTNPTAAADPFADSSAESQLEPQGTTTTTTTTLTSLPTHYEPPSGSPFDDAAAVISRQHSNSSSSSHSNHNHSSEKAKTPTSSKVKFWKRHTPTTSPATAKASS